MERPGEYARAWAAACAGAAGYLPMSPAETRRLLYGLTVRLVDAMHGDGSPTTAGYAVGQALVEAHLVDPSVLDHTLRLLGTEFPDMFPGPGERLGRLAGGVAAGYVAALRERTLAEQEALTVAVLDARRQAEQAVRYQAEHDPLTGLANRTVVFDRLTAALRRAGPDDRVGLCYLGLDGFKLVNNSLGHSVGDQLLVIVAGRLSDSAAGRGHLVARMGGDEFVILLDGPVQPVDVAEVAQAALTALREPVHLAGNVLSVSASIGVLAERADRGTAADLIQAADVTLHWAKADGRDRWVLFDRDRLRRDQARYGLAAAMPAALARGQFVVEYQPMVRLTDEGLAGVEALVRWDHPELGRLLPDRFVGLAEETGLIVELGRWVLAVAARQAADWNRRFPDARLVLSVNLAARQASDESIVDDVARVLRDTGLPPELLQLELTESAVMSNGGTPLPSLARLVRLGVRIAIDDFGTGYSNLAYLRTLPIQGLKLAGPFVAGLRDQPTGQPDERILDALVRLAHALGLTVTAEAVETGHQASVLQELGCDHAQGWYYAAAAPPDRVAQLLAERHGGTQ